VNEITVHIVFVLIAMTGWYMELLDVKGAFLHGEFDEETTIYMKVPEGLEKYYGNDDVLMLWKTIYGLKQATYAFWANPIADFYRYEVHKKQSRSLSIFCMDSLWINYGFHGLMIVCAVVKGKESRRLSSR
jgi:hypothetical protein